MACLTTIMTLSQFLLSQARRHLVSVRLKRGGIPRSTISCSGQSGSQTPPTSSKTRSITMTRSITITMTRRTCITITMMTCTPRHLLHLISALQYSKTTTLSKIFTPVRQVNKVTSTDRLLRLTQQKDTGDLPIGGKRVTSRYRTTITTIRTFTIRMCNSPKAVATSGPRPGTTHPATQFISDFNK